MSSESIERGSKRKSSSNSSSNSEDNEPFCVEESSESEPEVECDNWDFDCKILTTNLKSNNLTGYHLMPTCSPNPDNDLKKKIKLSPEIRSDLLDETFKTSFEKSWNQNETFRNNDSELITEPFKVSIISNFLQNPCLLNDVRAEFNDIDWNPRRMDLYEFFQSQDLKHLTSHEAINSVYKFLQNDVMKWVAELTNLNLTHISATCSFYGNTDYLLVHDDQREDRMVAFILYLTELDGWNENKGGALQILSKDDNGHPLEVVKDIYPANNQLIFFPVANDSYHQVAEVTAMKSCRLSINGWFHSTTPPVFTTPSFKPNPKGLYGDIQNKPVMFDSDLSSWLTEDYLENDIIQDIKEYFEDNSEISLRNFLQEEPFLELSQILQSDALKWIKIGPPNRHCYEILETDNLPLVLERFLRLFQSKQMFDLLHRFTALDLNHETAYMKYELQKWSPGCYSLLGDYDWYEKKELDLVLNFNCKNNSDVIGGRTLYISTDEQVQDALITLEPEENNLNLVYRDTARFTQYFSKLSRCRCFYTLICSYSE